MSIRDVLVPEVGGGEVDIIEILVAVGDQVTVDDGLITVESDKASMDIPAPFAGTVKEVLVAVGDKIGEGQLVARVDAIDTADPNQAPITEKDEPSPSSRIDEVPTSLTNKSQTTEGTTSVTVNEKNAVVASATQNTTVANNQSSFKDSVYAGPAVRRLAREFGIDLTKIHGSGEKNRITKGDVQAFVKQRLHQGGGDFSMPSTPAVDFSKFGEVEIQALSKINKLTGANLHRNWITVPHVTQFDEADITDMEAFRKANKKIAEQQGAKLTPIVFVMKAVVAALKQFPRFNASLDASGENLVIKKYYHLGVAVDTPDGLVVPVIRDVEQKGLLQLAQELATISKKAREKRLTPLDMQSSCFAISSLGGIGGTAFTPIVNAPDVAILGLAKSSIKPVWQNEAFVPRLKLPLSLSYDHRVIDGADGARFITFLSTALSNPWQMIL